MRDNATSTCDAVALSTVVGTQSIMTYGAATVPFFAGVPKF